MNTSQIDRYSLKQYTRLMISFFGCLFVLALFQYGMLYYKGVIDTIFSVSFLKAIVHQIGFTALMGIVMVLPFNFWENLRSKYGFNLVFVLLSFVLIFEALLTAYYCTTLVPLGSDILGYSYADMKITIANSGGFMISFYLLIGISILISLFLALYRITSKVYHRISKMYPFTIVLFSLFMASLFTDGKPINQNKVQYLAVNVYNTSTEDNSYTSKEEYPLVQSANVENVLGEYFNLKEEKPNIVFIMVEGLGRDFVGEGAEYGGFTPYLDSLTTKSLYWENFLSNTGRTFGVLPSLLGSLPFGKSGFMELEEYPNKLTMFSVLKNNGYHTSFYQGTNSSFDKVDRFLTSENVDFVLDKSGFGSKYQKQAEDAAGSSWGYPDMELFKKSLSFERGENQPRLEVYMTISTHEPFIPPNQDLFEGKVKNILENGSFDSRVEKIIEKNDNVFATLLYTDDAIKWFMESYKTQPNYENTIFIITGDHRLIPIPQRNTISRFHVPMIMFSPMLTTTRKMSSVSSHFDITPSILALLSNSYELKMPKKVAWMGGALDMETAFRSTKNIPLMRNKNELKEYISKEKLYTDGDIMELDENMNVSSAFGGGSIESTLERFKSVNHYVTTENKIIPDSLAIFTIQKEQFTDSETVWLNSVYDGKDSDKGYFKARDLAWNKKWDKALLLCRYNLSGAPSHIDTKILMGRVNSWKGNHEKAAEILQECISVNPNYIDSYAALFDVYYWSDKLNEGLELIDKVEANSSSANEIVDKISRARTIARNAGIKVHKPKQKEPATTIASVK
ncbi:phosphoglycerol transferase MdoB-like AlkP superfamily enzyme [Maribacter caenipelagi]|uniref:Phosphoglycerol transferase MdoB-like AlkP superfamily enzyme n=1 Tax=Maribacter caenipelagi TaxID=1447781 RepID=A0A4R7D5Q1_9FLAO|nr:LTA synthase family protein [Maribacter caenipelagi]TDS15024.1 phosphoglycerol transferase MdoB-like AlkP superfamily enzyme [Maribacter caenipelagi]